MERSKLRIYGLIFIVCIAIVGLNFFPEEQASVKVKKKTSDRLYTNLEAFGRLYGYIRYFHPSDEAAELNWNRFGIYGAGKVKNAKNDEELKTSLEELFLPIAPTLSLFLKEEKPPKQKKMTPTGKVVFLQHYGPSGLQSSLYESKRVEASVMDGTLTFEEGHLFPSYPKIVESYEGELGDSIHFNFPLPLFVDNGKTLGTTKKSWENYEKLKSDLEQLDEDMNAGNENYRYTGIISAWNLLVHFHPGALQFSMNPNQELRVALEDTADDKNPDDYFMTLTSLMKKTDNGQAILTFREAKKNNRRLPIMMDIVEEKVVVTGSHDTANFKTGDIIESINGVEARGYVERLSQGLPGSPQFRTWMAIDSILDLDGAEIVYTRDGEEKTATLSSWENANVDEFNRMDHFWEIEEGIYYFNLSMDIKETWKLYLDILDKAKGIIFDMRTMKSDELLYREIIAHLSERTVSGPVEQVMQVIYPHKEKATFAEKQDAINPVQPKFKGKIVFLANAGTVGPPEYFLRYVKDHGLGTIVGCLSGGRYGKTQTYQVVPYIRGTMAGTNTLGLDGHPTYHTGIVPDVPVTRTYEGVRNQIDEDLLKALRFIKE
ncbi:S41 family peptidase [Bacillus sp. FJAT-27445]|uniref:S41 family peptidase n=1 Tax=Bacillus sp. FJAT-27445 TaxID=1679166 RepID=UPI000743B84E|nr:S41 family peptidase [Bacillus sp. FJAT-27445]